MKLTVIALRVLIVPVLQREPASVWRNNWSGFPVTYSRHFGAKLKLNHKEFPPILLSLCNFLPLSSQH